MAVRAGVVHQRVVADTVRHARVSGRERALAIAHEAEVRLTSTDIVAHALEVAAIVSAGGLEAPVVELLQVVRVLVRQFGKLARVGLAVPLANALVAQVVAIFTSRCGTRSS